MRRAVLLAVVVAALLIVHHSGRRDLYLAGSGRSDPDVASFTDDQARRVGAILAGVHVKPAAVAQVEAVIAGTIVAATIVAPRVERLVLPLRDAFAAIFFAFGLSLDPGDAADVLPVVLSAVALSFVLDTLASVAAARLIKEGPQAAARIGLTVLARGEFSLVLASLAAAAGLDPCITPFVGLYVFILAIASPVLASKPNWLARLLSAVNLLPAAR